MEAASREFEAILESNRLRPSEPCGSLTGKIAVAMPAAGAVARGSSFPISFHLRENIKELQGLPFS